MTRKRRLRCGRRWRVLLPLAVLSAAVAGLLAAEPEEGTSPRAVAREILAGWMRGLDVGQKVSAYSDRRITAATRRPAVEPVGSTADFDRSVQALRDIALRVEAGGGNADGEMRAAYLAFETQDRNQRGELETRAARLAELGVSAEIEARFEAARGAYLEASERLHRALGAVGPTPAGSPSA